VWIENLSYSLLSPCCRAMLGPGPQKNSHTHYLPPGDACMILVDLCFGLVRCGLLLLKGAWAAVASGVLRYTPCTRFCPEK
jgi:hypothetical protein